MIFKPSFGAPPGQTNYGISSQPGIGNSPSSISSSFDKQMADAGIIRPQYSSVLDGQGNLPDYLQIKSNYDPKYFNEMKSYVEGGDSPWLQTQQTQIADQGAESIGALGAQNASGLQEAERGLAMRRGLTGGASERLQELGDEQAMFKRQDINRGMETQNLAATATEAADKQQTAKMLPGLQLQQSAYESDIQGSNIANMLAEKDRERQAQMDIYKEQMSAWASAELGKAMARRL